MTWYETFLWLHVTTAAIWVGGAFVIQVFALRVLGADDPERTVGFARDVEYVGTRVLIPASAILLLSGIGMVLNVDWDWGEPFISAGLAIWLVSFAAGAGFLGPESGRIAAVVEAEGPASPDAQRRIRRILLYSRVELLLLLLVVFLMAVKLGT